MNHYARVSRDKVKTTKELVSRFKHNERIFDVQNADMDSSQNIEFVSTNGKDYSRVVQETLDDLKGRGVNQRKLRTTGPHPQTLAFEYVIGFSREMAGQIDPEQWAKDTLTWLDETVNPPDHKIYYKDKDGNDHTGEVQNIKHAVLHMDESSPHLHVLVVPIDAAGHLNTAPYDGRAYLCSLQTSYAEAMKKYGLERGVEGSIAKREDIARYHNALNEAVNAKLRDPLPGETAQEYKKYAEEEYQNEKILHRKDVVQLKSDLNRELSRNRRQDQIEYNEEKALTTALKRLRGALGKKEELTEDDLNRLRHIVHEKERYDKAVREYPDRDAAGEAEALRQRLLGWQIEQEREEQEKAKKHEK